VYLCPTCGREPDQSPTCKCGADLRLLQQIVVRADHLFNPALEAYQNGQGAQALQYLAANAVLVPFDIEARLVQAKLLAQSQHRSETQAIVHHVQVVEPTHPELAGLVEWLAQTDEKKEED